jgi:hypothetical protein
LPTVLSDVAGISVFSADAATEKTVRLAIGTKNREIFNMDLDLPAEGGWHDLFFPAGFISHQHDAVLSLEAISGQPAFAIAKGTASSRQEVDVIPRQSLALRVWRNASPKVHPLRSNRTVNLSSTVGLAATVLGENAISASSQTSQIGQLVSFPDGAVVQTHPIEGETTNYAIRDVDISEVDEIEATVSLAHPDSSAVRFVLGLIAEGDEEEMYQSLKCRESADRSDDGSTFTSMTITRGDSARLAL